MQERKTWKVNGFLAIFLALVSIGATVYYSIHFNIAMILASSLLALIILSSLTIVQPNQTRVVVFFGRYMGKHPGQRFVDDSSSDSPYHGLAAGEQFQL